jgi:hypothetical protein
MPPVKRLRTHSLMMRLGMASDTVQSLATVGLNRVEGLKEVISSLVSAPSPYLPSLRF